jgi:hypothetical protein
VGVLENFHAFSMPKPALLGMSLWSGMGTKDVVPGECLPGVAGVVGVALCGGDVGATLCGGGVGIPVGGGELGGPP